MADTKQDFGTVIGADAFFKGELRFESAAMLLGEFEGSISAKGLVHVAKGATCNATVEASDIEVEGLINGNVTAHERIDLKPNGTVKGDITAARMSMADGASIDGHIRIGPAVNGKSSSKTEVKPQASSASSQNSGGSAKPGLATASSNKS
ncbi:MAG: polymer-forming cytoskeletal protein [Phycisphaerales bacterium]|nr:polymer-forming cytoskeletal protein [Phycisphaerales bacterium]